MNRIALFLLFVCSQAYSAVHTITELNLKIDIPSGWSVKTTPYTLDAVDPSGAHHIEINLDFVPNPNTFSEKDKLKELEKFCLAYAGTNIGIVDSGRVTFMGLPALFAGYRYTAPDGKLHCAVTYVFDNKAGKAQITIDSTRESLVMAGYAIEDIVKTLAPAAGPAGYHPKTQDMYFYTANLKVTFPYDWKPALTGNTISGETKSGVKWALEIFPESVFEMKSQFEITALLKKHATARYGKLLQFFGESAIGGKGMTVAALHFSLADSKKIWMYYLVDTGLGTFLFSTQAEGTGFTMSSKDIESFMKSFKKLTDW
ncbi:MAG: hypothetical protein A2Y33_05680 [Spirochaetes bacterium GWF1_51_8]|nr:MAG: hypothetical protein A2Y33_05680 [Spirochaetes bacterium GWF1_51_8]